MSTNLNERFDALILKLRQVNPFILMGGVALLAPFMTIFLALVSHVFPALAVYGNPVVRFSAAHHYFVAVIIGPPVETAIFQSSVLLLTINLLKLGRLNGALISTAIFIGQHGYSPGYMVGIIPSAVGFALLYLVRMHKGGRPWLSVTLAHALSNAIVFIISWSHRW
jgi:hypothetical protein